MVVYTTKNIFYALNVKSLHIILMNFIDETFGNISH